MQSLATIIPAVIASAIGVVIIAYLGRTLLSVVPFRPREWLFRWRLHQARQRVAASANAVEKFVAQSDPTSALLNALCLGLNPPTQPLADLLRSHHLAVLEQLLQLAEVRGAHLGEISEFIDELFETRHALHLGRMQVATTRVNIRRKRSADGKTVPEWTNAEFSKKTKEISEKLEINEKLIREQLRRAVDALQEAATGKGMTVH